jgi:hypothetical protein
MLRLVDCNYPADPDPENPQLVIDWFEKSEALEGEKLRNLHADWQLFIGALSMYRKTVSRVLDDPSHWLGEPTKKSRERELLWEPLFDLWRAGGGRVGFSQHGPIVRMISELHKGLSIPPPNLNALRQAVRDFQRR